MALIKCPECGKKISDSVEKCQNCGKEITESDIETARQNMEKSRKKKRNVIIVFAFVAIIGIGASCGCYFWIERNKHIEERQKEEQQKEEKQKIEKEFDKIISDVLTNNMNLYCQLSEIEECITNVWHNCIFEVKDKETNKWTLSKNGMFKDFSVAVNDVIEDKKNYELSNLYKDFETSASNWDALVGAEYIPEKYKDVVTDISEYINDVTDYYMLVLFPEGTYTEFVDNSNELSTKIDNEMLFSIPKKLQNK